MPCSIAPHRAMAPAPGTAGLADGHADGLTDGRAFGIADGATDGGFDEMEGRAALPTARERCVRR